jgi:hypothetical protein
MIKRKFMKTFDNFKSVNNCPLVSIAGWCQDPLKNPKSKDAQIPYKIIVFAYNS